MSAGIHIVMPNFSWMSRSALVLRLWRIMLSDLLISVLLRVSNNSPTVMKNIVVYHNWHRTTADGLLWYYDSPESFFVSARNYWLGRNIKGETDSMQMSTVNGALMDSPLLGKRQNDRWIFRGLWEMTGDDMGGPFVSLTLPMDSKQWKQKGDYGCDNIVVEGFVFAPGKKKRNAMRELEALLYTVKINKASNKTPNKASNKNK